MGGASSSLESAHRVEITQLLKVEYDKLIESGISDAELQQAMVTKYNEYLAKLSSGAADEKLKDTVVDSAADVKTAAAKGKSLPPTKPVDIKSTRRNRTLDRDPSVPQKKLDASKAPPPVTLPIKKSGTRRRSFEPSDGTPQKSAPPEHEPSETSNTSHAVGQHQTLDPIDEAKGNVLLLRNRAQLQFLTCHFLADSWESVVLQPSCTLCNMFFQTEAKRDRHIKYSVCY